MKLVIANKLYSSWSMRPWLVLRAFDIAFDEEVIPLRRPETAEAIWAHSPTGKVPVLTDGTATVWESLAIIEYIAETHADKAIWPTEKNARATARAIAAEMATGFMPLRAAYPMNLGRTFAAKPIAADVAANIARIEDIWSLTRAEFGTETSPFLFGAFTAADAMYAPVAARFKHYSVPVMPESQAYIDAITNHPAYLAWQADALCEPWTVAAYEDGHTAIADHRTPPHPDTHATA